MIIDEVEKCFTSNLSTNGAVPVNIQKVEMSKDTDILMLTVKATWGGPRSLLIYYRSRGDLEDVEDRIKKYYS